MIYLWLLVFITIWFVDLRVYGCCYPCLNVHYISLFPVHEQASYNTNHAKLSYDHLQEGAREREREIKRGRERENVNSKVVVK